MSYEKDITELNALEEFEEFKKKFEASDKGKGCFCETDIHEATFYTDLNDDNQKYWIWTLIDCEDIIIGEYDTLKEAYEALKEICKLNKVEME